MKINQAYYFSCLILLISCFTVASEIEDNITKQFTRDLLESSEIQNYWYGTTMEQPGGGYLYKFYFDLDQDGVNEMFISSSLNSSVTGLIWRVYKMSAGDETFLTEILLQPDGFRYQNNGESGVVQLLVNMKGGEYWLYEYKFGSTGYLGTSARDASDIMRVYNKEGGRADLGKALSIGEVYKPEISKILYFKYSKNGKKLWSKYNHKFPPFHQQKDPADRTALEAYTDWLPREYEKIFGGKTEIDTKEIPTKAELVNNNGS